jgi:ArsR family transcriptional regulator
VRELVTITKALADENRIRLLAALQHGELCVCQLIALLELAPSTVSKHMSILWHARLVESRKHGRWVFFQLAGENAMPQARAALAWTLNSLKDDPGIERDRKRLEEILAMDPEAVCRLIQEK